MNARDTSNRMRGLRPLLAALAATASCSAWAEDPSPWSIGVTQSLTRDSNVYRLNNGLEPLDGKGRGDTYSSTGLIGGLDQSIGRQHFYGTANVRYNKYLDHDDLSNTSYGLNAGWDWTSIWNLSGGVNVSANQSLAQLDGNSSVQQTQGAGRNLVKTDQIGANIGWGGTGLLSVQGAWTHSRVRYSLPSQFASESSGDSGSLGTYYNISPDLTAGVAFRLTRTEQPQAVQSTSEGRNVDLSLNWRHSVQTGVNARLSWTHQTNAGGGNQDFDGLTGSLAATWAPTAKLGFSVAYNRDAGTNGTFFNVPASSGPSGSMPATTVLIQNSQVANSLSLGATYAATAKIGVTAGYTYRSAKVGDFANNTYDDTLQSASLGASWAITRAWQLGCNLSHEKRDTGATLGVAYTANVIGCSAQFTLR
ncbi:MAG: hypothetical protein V4750_03685 [Pseudomonadota bacterium]